PAVMVMTPAARKASTKTVSTTQADRPVIAVTWGRLVGSGVCSRVCAMSLNIASKLDVSAEVSQPRIWFISQSMSGAQNALEGGQDDRGEQRQRVADPGALEGALGPLDLGRVTAGHQVPD